MASSSLALHRGIEMFAKKVTVLLAGAALMALPLAAMAQGKGKGSSSTTTTVPVGGSQGPVTSESLISRYSALAGSPENATSLVNGLRNGTPITLSKEVMAASQAPYVYTPPPPPAFGPMGMLPPPPPPPPPGPTEPTTITVNFTPPTGNMGFGNVDVALAFSEAQLTESGIATPDPNQLHAALMGGEIIDGNTKAKRVLPGILKLRASGMGWGQIAAQFGYKLQ